MFGGRYQVVRQLGCGNFSKVFLVKDTYLLDTVRAIKLLHPGMAVVGRSEVGWLRKLQTVDRDGRLSRTRFYGTISHGEHFGIVLENLQPILQRVTESVNSLRRLVVDVALLLDAMHRPSFSAIHADIKLENIMYNEVEERFRVIDFGNCAPISGLKEYLKTFEIQSLLYRAPEVLVGSDFGTAIDIWSFGVVLVQLLTDGHPPFQATDRNKLLGQIAEIVGPFPEIFQQGKFYQSSLPLETRFEQAPSFWQRWRKSNLARMLRIKDPDLVDLLAGMLECNPKKRIDAREILLHPFVAPLVPLINDVDLHFSTIVDSWR